jgi:hypothetical protein
MSGRQPQLLIWEQYTKRSGHQDTGTCKTGERVATISDHV